MDVMIRESEKVEIMIKEKAKALLLAVEQEQNTHKETAKIKKEFFWIYTFIYMQRNQGVQIVDMGSSFNSH